MLEEMNLETFHKHVKELEGTDLKGYIQFDYFLYYDWKIVLGLTENESRM